MATATKTMNGALGPPESDLAQLWQAAVEEYEKKTKTSLRMSPFKSVEEVMKGTEGMSQKFKDFRHDQGKTDKVRTAFKNNLWLIQKVVNTVQMVGNAASAFPPAMPASLIFSAFGQVMTTFGQMSADYDKIMGFFDFTHRFLDRLSIIQDRTPDLPPFKRCVVRVFSSMLVICSVAQEYIKEKRMKKWFHTLVDGSDSNLGGAYKDMESAINELSQAVNLATLRTVDIIAEMVRNMTEDVEFIVTKVTVIDERTHATHSNTNILLKQGEEMTNKQDAAISKADKLLEDNRELKALMKKITEQSSNHDRPAEKEKAQLNQKKQKSDPADKKRDALNQVKSYLTTNTKWTAVSKDVKMQRKEIKNSHVTGTGDWILKDPTYQAWTKEESPILWLRGPAGIGKSFLTYATLTDLEAHLKEDKSRSSAYFFFREEISSLTSWDEALCSIAYQIAEQDPKYGELLAAELSKKEGTESHWTRFFSTQLPEKSESTVFLVLDGVDEMEDKEEQDKVIAALRQVVDEKLKIQILITSRADMAALELLNLTTLDVTTVNMASDIRAVIKAGCKSLPRLRKFRKPVKHAIIKKLRSKADGMRYVEHMLRRLSYIGREKAVLKDLERNLPESLNALYSLMLNECQKDRTEEQYQALKKLFAWLAYSKRALTLNEAAELVALTANESVFDIEDELIGRSARILELARTDEHEDDELDDKFDDSAEESGNEAEDDIKDNGSSPLTFQERSLREYFQAIDVDKQGLRTPPSAAHLTILEMCLDTLLTVKPTRPNYNLEMNLTNYSANFWVQHFVEIDLDRTSDTDVVRLVGKLYRVFQNENNVARILEYFSENAYSETLDSPDSAASVWLDKAKEWVNRASSVEAAALPLDTQTWAKDFTLLNAMIPLARGHVENWYHEYYGIPNIECFRFARDALTLSGADLSQQTLETVLAVADYFPDIEKDAGAMRAISAQSSGWQIAPETVMEYTNKGLEMLSGNSALRFYLTRSLSISNARLENIDKAVELLDEALSYRPQDWREDPDLVGMVEVAYSEKARYYEFLNKPEEAVEAYNKSRSVNPSTALSGWLLDDITRVYHEERDPKAVELFKLLQSWSDKEISAWFGYVFDYNDIYARMRLNQIAGYGGQEGKDFVAASYDKYISTLTPPSNSLFLAKSALATLYRVVIGDEVKALALLRELIKTNLADYDFSTIVEERFSEIRGEATDMIFSEFCRTADPVRKTSLLEEIKNMPTRTDALSEPGVQVLDSNTHAVLALCLAVMGPFTEYSKVMQSTFDNCMEGLSDSFGWNDSGCFRLLAKILSFVEGLERDALIAISLQFSQVTEPQPTEESDGEQSETGLNNESQDTTEDNTAIQSEAAATAGAEEGPGENQEDHSTRNGTIHISETTISSTTIEDGTVKESSTIVIEEATMESNNPPAETSDTEPAADGTTAPEQTPDPVNEYALPPIEDEELETEQSSVWCDGECGLEWSSWQEPLYTCLCCANCDLCTACLNKRMAQNKGEANTYWHSYCANNHKYLKGPLKGWKGVKDGVIRIEAEDGTLEKFEVKQWLKELKEERWPKAWENFWLRRTVVNDVGF